VKLRYVVMLVFVAGCRLRFEALDDADVDTLADPDVILGVCGPGVIICDDFESDAYKPWKVLTTGGPIDVLPGCGTNGSRCARSTCTVAGDSARLIYTNTNPLSTLTLTAVVTPRMLGTGSTQLLAMDFKDGGTFSTQVGASIFNNALALYEYNYTTSMTSRSTTATLPVVDVPMTLSVHVDLGTQTSTLDLDGAPVATLALSGGLTVASASTALVGLWCTAPVQSFDYDDAVVR
jgi:hypothetical protein